MNKHMDKIYDNGLTDEEQKKVDDAYENLMSKVKDIDLRLYEKLRAKELSAEDVFKLMHTKENKRMTRIVDDQYTLL